jgi:uncharacterized membrane protein
LSLFTVGLIGLLVPLALVSLTVVGTIVATLHKEPWEDISVPLVVAWSIVAVLVLVTIVRSLSVIRQLPRPTGEASQRATAIEKQASASSTAFQGKHSDL